LPFFSPFAIVYSLHCITVEGLNGKERKSVFAEKNR
jgi:hypothetical protein